jgi:repressor LexA
MRPKNNGRKMEIYGFVSSYIKREGVAPTTQMISDHFGMAKSTVSKYMNRLAEEGLIEKYGRYQTVTADSFSYTKMPIIGSVACGEPILAIEEVEGYLPIDEDALGAGEYFGLIASGESMIGVGINDGDTVYVRRQNTADDGEIVVAMVEDEFSDGWRATLKTFYRDEKNNRYILHPENPDFDDIILTEVHIVGIAVSVLRTFEGSKGRRRKIR